MNILGFLEKKTRIAFQDINYQEHPLGHKSNKMSSGDLGDCFRQSTDVSKASGIALTSSPNVSVKKPSKKKKRKKGKSIKLHLDYNIAPEIVDTSVASLSTGLSECDLDNASTFNQTVNEVIGKSLHDRIDAKLDSLSSETAKFARNQRKNTEKAVVGSMITSIPVLDTMTVFSTTPLTDYYSIETCEKGSNGVSFGTEEPDLTQDEVIADSNNCIAGRDIEPPCPRSLSADSIEPCHGSSHTSFGADEADSNQCSEVSDIPATLPIQNSLAAEETEVKDSKLEVSIINQCSGVCDICRVEPTQSSKNNDGSFQMSTSKSRISSRMNSWKKSGKENAQVTWQRTGRFIGSSLTDSIRMTSDHNCPCVDVAASSDRTSSLKRNSSKGSGLLPPLYQFSTDSFQQETKYLGIRGRMMCQTHEHNLADESEWARNGEYVLRPREDDVMVDYSWERSKGKTSMLSKPQNANHGRKQLRGFWVSKTNLYKPGTRYKPVNTKASEIPETVYLDRNCFAGRRISLCNHEHKSKVSEAHRVEGSSSLSSSHVKPKPLYTSSVEDDKSSVCSELELSYNGIMKEYFPPGSSSCKWIPVGKIDSLNSKIGKDIDHNLLRKVIHHQELVNDVRTDDCLSKGGQRNLGHGQNDYCSASVYKSNNLRMHICSDMAVQALDASYRLQIACESFQLATGSHIAEFEKLLYLVSPVITSSSLQQHSDKVFNEFLKPKIALRDVWKWYEGRGNYGLQVKAYDSQKPNRSEANALFYAHFVPFLSAIQLFDSPQHSSRSSPGNMSNGVLEKGNIEHCLCPSSSLDLSSPELVAEPFLLDPFNSKKRMRQCGIATPDENGCSSDDSQVIFEYFENEPPHQRKPLFVKIKDLLEVDASQTQVFGDPSRLECMDLQDLHPASWYSVAWYPIYRIPEGCFRASFLTYHSLGHLFPGCTRSDSVQKNEFCVVFPALGMLSYNAEGECWFQCKIPPEPLLKDCELFDVSEFLKKRLKTLKETATLFSRGNVRKEHTSATNRHPDYEFFISRKK